MDKEVYSLGMRQNAPAGLATATAPSAIQMALEGQREMLRQSHSLLESLYGRLRPVLAQIPQNGQDTAKQGPASSVADSINENSGQLHIINEALRDILNRLEV